MMHTRQALVQHGSSHASAGRMQAHCTVLGEVNSLQIATDRCCLAGPLSPCYTLRLAGVAARPGTAAGSSRRQLAASASLHRLPSIDQQMSAVLRRIEVPSAVAARCAAACICTCAPTRQQYHDSRRCNAARLSHGMHKPVQLLCLTAGIDCSGPSRTVVWGWLLPGSSPSLLQPTMLKGAGLVIGRGQEEFEARQLSSDAPSNPGEPSGEGQTRPAKAGWLAWRLCNAPRQAWDYAKAACVGVAEAPVSNRGDEIGTTCAPHPGS